MLDGEAIHRLPTKQVARTLGLLPQSPIAPDGILVGDLVRAGRTPHQSMFRQWSHADEAAVRHALDATGTTDLAERSVDELSGGQRQRVWMAMALAQETDLMLLDEPTTFLDISHQIEVLDLVAQLNRRRSDDDRRRAPRPQPGVPLRRTTSWRCATDGSSPPAAPADVITEQTVREVFGLESVVIPDPISGTPLVVPHSGAVAPTPTEATGGRT